MFHSVSFIEDDSESGEMTAFRCNYATLCNTMTDVDDLLKYFVTEKIITTNEEEKIKSRATKSDRVKALLLNISGPLQAGDKNGFCVMLRIMKKYGTKATQDLAISTASSAALDLNSISAEDELPKSMFYYDKSLSNS